MRADTFRQFLDLLLRLQESKIAYSLRHSRDDALMIEVFVPGERWEIEFVDYQDEVHVEIERFRSDGHIADESALKELFSQFSDKEDHPAGNSATRK